MYWYLHNEKPEMIYRAANHSSNQVNFEIFDIIKFKSAFQIVTIQYSICNSLLKPALLLIEASALTMTTWGRSKSLESDSRSKSKFKVSPFSSESTLVNYFSIPCFFRFGEYVIVPIIISSFSLSVAFSIMFMLQRSAPTPLLNSFLSMLGLTQVGTGKILNFSITIFPLWENENELSIGFYYLPCCTILF